MTEENPRHKALISNFTEGSIPGQLLRFAFPSAYSYALQVLYSVVDMMIIGQVMGSAGISAVSTASQIYAVLLTFCIGFSIGGQIYISQLIGKGRLSQLNQTIGTFFSVELLLSLIIMTAGILSCRSLLLVLNTPAEAFDFAMDYLVICCCGLLFTYGYNVVAAVLRGLGDSRHPFLFILLASIINLVLDIVFIVIFGWKTTGAALATILGQAVSLVCSVVFLYRRRTQFHFDFKLRSFIPDKGILKALLSLGTPFAVEYTAINISMVFVNALVNQAGVVASAVFGTGIRIEDIGNKINTAITGSCAVMIGQNFAAKSIRRIHRIIRCGWLYAGVFYLLFGSLCLLFPETLFSVFTNDADVIAGAPVFMAALLWEFPAMVVMRGTNGLIQGVGNAKLSLAIALFDGFVVRIGLSYLLGTVCAMGIYGYFLGYALAANATALPGFVYYVSGLWKRRKSLT